MSAALDPNDPDYELLSLDSSPPQAVQDGRTVAVQEDAEAYGPAMQACNPKERVYVLAVMAGETWANAARIAGYGTPDSTPATLATIGNRLKGYPRVSAALVEEAKQSLRSLAPKAVDTVRKVLDDFDAKARLKAADMILARSDPSVTRVEGKVEHTHHLDHDAEALNQLRSLKALGVARDKLIEVFGDFGLQRLEAKLEPKPLDVEFSEVECASNADPVGE